MDIPKRTKDIIDNYARNLWVPGGFVYAVLTNNLKEAFGRADAENSAAMKEIVKYVYNNIPSIAWGSEENVKRWLAQKK